MHHLIERGWFWIIPFDNNKVSKNRCAASGSPSTSASTRGRRT